MYVKLNFENNKYISYSHVIAVCELGKWLQIIGEKGEHVEYKKDTFDTIEIYKNNI